MRISCWSSYLCSSELVDAAAFLGADRVGRETLAVVDVVDLDALVLADAGDVEQPAVDRARAFVMQLRMGDRGAVDLGFEQGQLHGHGPWGEIGRAPSELPSLMRNSYAVFCLTKK